jgi:[FeFe] hydrogenase H-cluster maturation GTPase HydF
VFGRRNVGKSSLINAITGQNTALVSSVKGTTTDPVYKAMELSPIGPVVLIDTAGLDDVGSLGELRKQKTLEVLKKADLAIMVIEGEKGMGTIEKDVIGNLKERNIPIIGVVNKTDINKVSKVQISQWEKQFNIKIVSVSAFKEEGIEDLKNLIIASASNEQNKFSIIGDIIKEGDFVVLVVPIDSAAPKGRLILPQQQVIRDILDNSAIAITTKESELKQTLRDIGKKPSLVITDSQVFSKVNEDTPDDIPLTSFSILFARHKGDFKELVKGSEKIKKLKDGDKILIAEACTHHRQCNDIGTVKIPGWLKQNTGKKLIFESCSGMDFPKNLYEYALVIHCGGCMLNQKAMQDRIESVVKAGVPIVNYGVIIAYMEGILERAISVFKKTADRDTDRGQFCVFR